MGRKKQSEQEGGPIAQSMIEFADAPEEQANHEEHEGHEGLFEDAHQGIAELPGIRVIGEEERDLMVALTLDEKIGLIEEMNQRTVELNGQKEKLAGLKERVKSVTGSITYLEDKISELGNQVAAGEEQRPVRCVWKANDADGTKALIRTDTDEQLDVRPMELLDTRPPQGAMDGTDLMDAMDDRPATPVCGHCGGKVDPEDEGPCDWCGMALCPACIDGAPCPNEAAED